MPFVKFVITAVIAAIAADVTIAQQGPIRSAQQITNGSSSYANARISPDGLNVAFSNSAGVGYVRMTSPPFVEWKAPGRSSGLPVVWNASSTGFYFLESQTIWFVAVPSNNVTQYKFISGVPNSISPPDPVTGTIYGCVCDLGTTPPTYRLYEAPANGNVWSVLYHNHPGIPTLALDSFDVLGTGGVLFRETDGTQVGVRRHWHWSLSQNLFVDQSLGLVNGQLGAPLFAYDPSGGYRIDYTRASTLTTGLQQVGSKIGFSPGSGQVALTEGPERIWSIGVGGDRRWLACETQYPDNPTVREIALLPSTGGNLIRMERGRGYSFHGTPSLDATQSSIAFAATEPGGVSHIWIIRRDRELSLSPRLSIGTQVDLRLPLTATQVASIWIAGGQAAPITLPNFSFTFDLDLPTLTTLYTGAGNAGGGTEIALGVPIPNTPSLVGQRLFWQAGRVDTSSGLGDFSRFSLTRFF